MRYKNGINSSIAHTFYVLAVSFLFSLVQTCCHIWMIYLTKCMAKTLPETWLNFAYEYCGTNHTYTINACDKLYAKFITIYIHFIWLLLLLLFLFVSLFVVLHSLFLFASFVAPCLLQCWVKPCCCARMWVECASIRNFGFYFVYNLYEYFRYIWMDG